MIVGRCSFVDHGYSEESVWFWIQGRGVVDVNKEAEL